MGETFTIRNLADIEAIEQVPLSERVTEKSTYELISKGAAINPDAIAMSFIADGDRYREPLRVTYGQFMAKIRQTANMLADMGVRSTDVVTYLLPNLPQTHFVLWGAEMAGIANPINPMLEADTIKEICQAAGTKVLVALGDMPGVDIWPKVAQIRKSIPSLEKVVRVMGPSDEAEGIFSFEETVERYAGDRLTFDRQIAPDDIASLYHTGGTTGRPKLAKRSHGNEIALTWGLKAATQLQPAEAVMVGLPLFHCNGTCVTGLLPFSLGGEVVILSASGYRNPTIMRNFYRIVAHYKPVFFSCVPTVLSVLLSIPVGDADISSLKYLICGAAPLSVELFRRFEAHSGMKILEGYGLTESTCASCVNPKDGERKIGSIGIRLPYQHVKVMILGADGRYLRDAEVEEIGSVCISGPTAFKGYVEEVHNRGLWVKEGWFNTGDMGRMDKDGFFWLTGRMKELIIRGGHNIDPATIEEPLYQMAGIKMAAAVGRPDAHAGEVPVAYVELAEGAEIGESDIAQWVQSHIGERAAVPKAIYIVDQIPLTAVGKIFKPALRWDAIRRTYEQELAQLGELAQSVGVRVAEDKVHGTLATIRIKAAVGADRGQIEARVAELLARYTVRYAVECV
ncbi:MAG: AMP-binding protein [Desulfatitalea sp. BRH_c12]|nr:MAG: AMP-binding protein [Desulfatitalea sp. BRH_c12]